MKKTNKQPITNNDRQYTQLNGETSPTDAFRQAATYARQELSKIKAKMSKN